MNALISKSDESIVGMCGLLVLSVDGIKELEIGHAILPEYRRCGYATEAAIKCRDFAFANTNTASLISIIHRDNLPSKKVAQNMGMEIDKPTIYKRNPVEIFRVYGKDGIR